MTKNPTIVKPGMRIKEIVGLIKKTKHDGFPVVENGKVVGMLTYADLFFKEKGGKAEDVMQKRVVAIPPDMEMNAVARLMFRKGYSRFPVIDNKGKLLGLVTNHDVIRANIERVTPLKVETMKKTFESVHKTTIKVIQEEVEIENLLPTQGKVYKDELRAREYEIKKGLAEPLLIVKNGEKLILVDGHHRAIAAKNLGINKMQSYILQFENEVELGMEKTAEKQGLKNLSDIKILDGLSPYSLPLVLENGKVKKII